MKFSRLWADNLSRLTRDGVGSLTTNNGSRAIVSDHEILFNRRVSPRASAKLLSISNLATKSVGQTRNNVIFVIHGRQDIHMKSFKKI